jgi:hypothetical protein
VDNSQSQESVPQRGAVYVDGFNLYHPIRESKLDHLKWASLWRLGELLCESENLSLVKVVFCTAVPKHLPGSFERHQTFNAAQIASGVIVLKGHHVPDDGGYSEKQSDINVALSLILDGLDDVYDAAFLVSADSDQVATAKFFKERLAPKGKRLFAGIPFSKTFPTDYSSLGVQRRDISADFLERCVMGAQVQGKKGMINRPAEYAPPVGWVHPDDRPKGKAPKIPAGTKWKTVAKG